MLVGKVILGGVERIQIRAVARCHAVLTIARNIAAGIGGQAIYRWPGHDFGHRQSELIVVGQVHVQVQRRQVIGIGLANLDSRMLIIDLALAVLDRNGATLDVTTDVLQPCCHLFGFDHAQADVAGNWQAHQLKIEVRHQVKGQDGLVHSTGLQYTPGVIPVLDRCPFTFRKPGVQRSIHVNREIRWKVGKSAAEVNHSHHVIR